VDLAWLQREALRRAGPLLELLAEVTEMCSCFFLLLIFIVDALEEEEVEKLQVELPPPLPPHHHGGLPGSQLPLPQRPLLHHHGLHGRPPGVQQDRGNQARAV